MTLHSLINVIILNAGKLILNSLIGMIIIFMLLFFVYPLTYTSTVTILPPEKSNPYSLGSLLQGADFSSLMSGNTSASAQLYNEIIRSRTAAEITINKLSLMDYFDVDSELEAAEKLSKLINTEVTKEGILKISVPMSTPLFGRFRIDNDSIKQLSAKVSNTLAVALDSINRVKLSTKASRARIYIESELLTTKKELDSVENELMNFQAKNKTVSLPDQVKASIEVAAKLKTEMTTAEMNYNILSQNLKENSSLMEGMKTRMKELREQYEKVINHTNSDMFVSFSNAPQLGLKLSNLLREVKVKNEVYLLLQQQFYHERIQENRDVPTIEILDLAVPPLKASSPRLIIWTFLGGIFIFMFLTMMLLFREKRIKNYIS